MKTIHQYIAGSFLATFLTALLVLSFVLTVGLLFRATSLIAAGASAALVLGYLWSGIPGTLSLSIPIAALVSALLVFGRLSSDNEISAMRACGVRLIDIMRMPLLLALLGSLICLHLNGTVSPDSTYARRNIRRMAGAADLLAVITPGRFIDEFPGMTFFVGSREGANLRDVRILELMRSGRTRKIKAERAVVSENAGSIRLEMFNVTVDPVQEGRSGIGHAERAVRTIAPSGASASKDAPPARRIKDHHSSELLSDVLVAQSSPPDPANTAAVMNLSRTKTELSKRTVLALACLCFVAVGIPLGIKAHRRESAVGVVLCLLVATVYFLFLVAAESLAPKASFRPYWIACVPVLLCAAVSTALVARNP